MLFCGVLCCIKHAISSVNQHELKSVGTPDLIQSQLCNTGTQTSGNAGTHDSVHGLKSSTQAHPNQYIYAKSHTRFTTQHGAL